MSFKTDPQTLSDLKIFGKPGEPSIFDLYNHTRTRKGAEILEEMFQFPLSDQEAINQRSGIIAYFTKVKATFPFRTEWFDQIEFYLSMADDRTRLSIQERTLSKRLRSLIVEDVDYAGIHNGILGIIAVVTTLDSFIKDLPAEQQSSYYEKKQEIILLLRDPAFIALYKEENTHKLPYQKVVYYDNKLRFGAAKAIKMLLGHIYDLDVYLSVAKVALENNFTFPSAMEGSLHKVSLEGVYHPQVKNAIPNTIVISEQGNIVFLTGANMAGKSTFMKSLGIAMFIAHVGFPVAARKMEFSVMDGIYTTINLTDDLSIGSSHFYSEVLRVKKMAKEVGLNKNLFIIFDELFRGTNVKDAYEATIAVTEAFAKKSNCMFIVSTHIIEAAAVLKERCNNINFTYLPTRMSAANLPEYTYTLESGVTADRHGMLIIKNEGILEILKKRKNNSQAS
jgi:DNA mismatch repair protein MutS